MLVKKNKYKCKFVLGGYTKLYQEDISDSIGAKLVCIDNKFTLPTKIFTGSNSIKEFIE